MKETISSISPWFDINISRDSGLKSRICLDGRCIFCEEEINYPSVLGFNPEKFSIGPVCNHCKKKLTLKGQVAAML